MGAAQTVDAVDILRCPVTGNALHRTADGNLSAGAGQSYAVRDGIACLLPDALKDDVPHSDTNKIVTDFYDKGGWLQDDDGVFGETKLFVDTRPMSLAYTRKCIARLSKYFSKGGQYILDAGSGPIVHDGQLHYGDRFEKYICLDLSAQALRGAKTKLGSRGVYLQGDITKLPLKSESIDAITCNHVIYQLPLELQTLAFAELWRVLKPGGVAVIVYMWTDPLLMWRSEQAARVLFGRRPVDNGQASDQAKTNSTSAELPHHPQPRSWFEKQAWPFPYKLDIFRVVSNWFMKQHVPAGLRGRVFLNLLYMLQVVAPGFCGRHGSAPVIVIRKPEAASPKS